MKKTYTWPWNCYQCYVIFIWAACSYPYGNQTKAKNAKNALSRKSDEEIWGREWWKSRSDTLPLSLCWWLDWLCPAALCGDSDSGRLSGPWSSARRRSPPGLCSDALVADQPDFSACSAQPLLTVTLAAGAGSLPLQELSDEEKQLTGMPQFFISYVKGKYTWCLALFFFFSAAYLTYHIA